MVNKTKQLQRFNMAFQLLLSSAWHFSHFGCQKVEAMQRTTRDNPKLAYED
jgi:hypothetical protein